MTLAEVLVVLLVLAVLTAGAVAATDVRRDEALAAGRRVAADFHLARARAVAGAASLGVVFEKRGPEWYAGLGEDADFDGLSASDLRAGRDAWREPLRRFKDRYGAARPGFLPGVDGLTSPPPSPRRLDDLSDPVRFGAADVVSFGARGQATSGTLYLTDGRRQVAVVVYGATARVRTWEWEPGARAWRPR